MTTLHTPPRPLSRSSRRLCVGLIVLGFVLAIGCGWAYLASGVGAEASAFAGPTLLGFLLMGGPYTALLRRFQPLPDVDEKLDERQQ